MYPIKARLLKKRYVIPSIVAAVTLAGAGSAYAYFTANGSGTGSAQVGTASNWVINSTGPTGNLYPDSAIGGANTQDVDYSVTNPGNGDQDLTSVTISVANSDGSAWSVRTDPNEPACNATDFSVGGNTVGSPFVDTSLQGDYTAGQIKNGYVTIEMIDNGANQDNCQGLVVPLYFSIDNNPNLSIDLPQPNGGGGFYPNPDYLTVPSASVGADVSLTVTAIQPNVENPNGTITLSFDNADLTFTGPGSSDATCGAVTTTGTTSTVSCSYTDLAHGDTSKSFDFTAEAAGETFVHTVVSITGSGTATQTFGLDITG